MTLDGGRGAGVGIGLENVGKDGGGGAAGERGRRLKGGMFVLPLR